MKRVIKLINGWVRVFIWGLCPKCNSDAPELYDCKVCNWYRTSDRGMPNKATKKEWWQKFKSSLKQNINHEKREPMLPFRTG